MPGVGEELQLVAVESVLAVGKDMGEREGCRNRGQHGRIGSSNRPVSTFSWTALGSIRPPRTGEPIQCTRGEGLSFPSLA